MKKILIFGGAGFIGSRIAEMLVKEGHYVIVVDNLSTGKLSNLDEIINSPNFTFVCGDIRDYGLCLKYTKGIDFVINQAALVSVPKSIEDPLGSNDINVNGFLNILDVCRINKVKRVVYASSSAVYGDNLDLKKIEERRGDVISPYALSKLINEKYAKLYSSIYGLETVGLRYFNVYGPKQDPGSVYSGVISVFFDRVSSGQEINIFGDGSISRDFVFVDDVARANILACFSKENIVGKVYNIGTGKETTINQLAKLVNKLFGVNTKINYLPERLGDIKRSCANVKKAQDDLQFIPQVALIDGLKEIYNYYQRLIM